MIEEDLTDRKRPETRTSEEAAFFNRHARLVAHRLGAAALGPGRASAQLTPTLSPAPEDDPVESDSPDGIKRIAALEGSLDRLLSAGKANIV